MKILLVHNYYQHRGGEDAVFEAEAAMLQRHGHHVETLTWHNRQIEERSKFIVGLRSVWSRPSSRELEERIRSFQPDLVHFHNLFPLVSPAAYYACNNAGIPVVQTLHNYRLICPVATFFRDGHVCEDCLGKTPPWPGVLHACYRASRLQTAGVASMLTFHRLLGTWTSKVNLYIALTEFARSKMIEGGLPPDRIVTKPNFLYPAPETGDHEGDFALFVGRLTVEKGIETLLDAVELVGNIRIVVAGDGLLRGDVQNAADLRRNISYLGAVSHEEVVRLMSEARLLILPSAWYEVQPLTIIEAFACGLPVVASALGAMKEMIRDHETGLLFETGQADDLAAKLRWAWENRGKMNEMGKRARLEFQGKYTEQQNIERLMSIYTKAIELVEV